jgi:hypothetical protein
MPSSRDPAFPALRAHIKFPVDPMATSAAPAYPGFEIDVDNPFASRYTEGGPAVFANTFHDR